VGEPISPLEFGREVSRRFGFKDIAFKAASVRGTAYAGNLSLSSKETRRALSWIPTSHKTALAEIRQKRSQP
jgi:hypothetical protein